MSSPAPQEAWSPQKGSQYAFHESTFFVDELLYGGAAGGGKSDSLLTEAVRQVSIPNYRAIIFRRTYPELEKSLVPRAYDLFYGAAKPKNKGLEWEFPNGSVIYLSHLQREEDKEKHKSAEYDFIGFDELTSFTESQYTYLFSRCRGKNPKIRRYIRSATNPTGPGHSWVKKRFINPDPDDVFPYQTMEYDYAFGWSYRGRIYSDFSSLPPLYSQGEPTFETREYTIFKQKKSNLTRAFIPALLWGNAKLIKGDPEYTQRVQALSFKEQQALLYGSWDIFEGQFFSEWDPQVHVVAPFTISPSWRRFVGIDFGYTAPMAALWAAMDENGKLYVYRELYGTKMTTDVQAQTIGELSEKENIEWFAADPSMWAQSGRGIGDRHADIYDRSGISLTPSSNRRLPGWAIMHDYLVNGKMVFFYTCKNTIRTLPSLMHSKTNPEDLDTQQDDHAADALRYLLLTLKGDKTVIQDVGAPPIPDWWWGVKASQALRTQTRRVRLG